MICKTLRVWAVGGRERHPIARVSLVKGTAQFSGGVGGLSVSGPSAGLLVECHTKNGYVLMFSLKSSNESIQKWGGLASFVLAVALVSSALIYLMGNLRDAMGVFAYSLADLLYGPIWAVSLITVVFAIRDRIGVYAPRRMDMALLASIAAACAFVAVACIRAANRRYHLIHPELHLESSITVLTVWATLVAGVIGTAWHFFGWALLLIGSAGWTSKRLPRALSVLYLGGGIMSLFVYQLPDIEGGAAALSVVISIWQGILLLKTESRET